MKKVAKILSTHTVGIVNLNVLLIINAVAEGFNSKIQTLKADAQGFCNFFIYRTKIIFFCGRLYLFHSTLENP